MGHGSGDATISSGNIGQGPTAYAGIYGNAGKLESESFNMDSAAENRVFGVQRTWCLPRTPTGNILSAEPRSLAVRVRDEHQP